MTLLCFFYEMYYNLYTNGNNGMFGNGIPVKIDIAFLVKDDKVFCVTKIN